MIPAFALPGEMAPGQLGPTSLVSGRSFRNVSARIMSSVGMPSVMQTTSRKPASADSITASAAKAAGTKMTDVLAPVAFTASATVLKIGHPFVRRPALARRDAPNHGGAIRLRLLGVEGAFFAGEALNNQPGRLIEQNRHYFSVTF